VISRAAEIAREALAKTARDHDAAIIVMGRHQSRLAELFFGSVSARLHRFLPEADIQEV
jgi:nucleotide-binding universal stress UspA family protein